MAVIDKAGQEEEVEGKTDGVEIAEDSEIGTALNEQEDKSDADGRAADRKDEDGSGKEGDELSEEKGSGDEVVDPGLLIQTLSAKVDELEKRLSQPAPLAPKEVPVEQKAPQITEEEWAKYEEERGIPRTAQTWITNTLVRAVQDIEKVINQRFARIDRKEAIQGMASNPEFSDANKYQKEMDQYLEKVDPRYHANPEVLKDALIWARGMNYKKTVQNVRNEREVNKRISGVARPSTGGAKSSSKSTPALTALEKSAADAVGMSYSDYAASRSNGRIIAH
jgi:hypothetical protein